MFEYGSALIGHWVALMSGIVSVAIGVFLRVRQWRSKIENSDITNRAFMGVGLLCIFYAGYQAWSDEHKKVLRLLSTQGVYLESSVNPQYGAALFSKDQPIDLQFRWTRTGSGIAVNAYTLRTVKVESNVSITTQKTITSDFQHTFEQALAKAISDGLESSTVGYSDQSKTIWTSASPSGPIADDKVLEDLWNGRRILFAVSAARYESEGHQAYETHACKYLQPPGKMIRCIGQTQVRGHYCP